VTFTAADDVAGCAAKLDVDDAVEDEIDGADLRRDESTSPEDGVRRDEIDGERVSQPRSRLAEVWLSARFGSGRAKCLQVIF